VGFFSAAGERSGPATFEGVLILAAPAPAGFLQIVGDYFPVFHALRVLAITVYRRRTSRRLLRNIRKVSSCTLPLDRLNQFIPKINAVTTKDVTA
jgi:hypothetical protein